MFSGVAFLDPKFMTEAERSSTFFLEYRTILTVTNDSTTLPYFQKTYYYTLQRENDAFYFVISSEFERGGQRHLPSFFKRSALEQLC